MEKKQHIESTNEFISNDELVIVALLFALLIQIGVYFSDTHKIKKQVIEVKKVVIEINNEKQETEEKLKDVKVYSKTLETNVKDLKEDVQNSQIPLKLLKDLRSISNDPLAKLTVAVCFDESELDYNKKHSGKYDKTTIGICGIKSDNIGIVPGLNWKNINSLEGGLIMVRYLYEKHNGKLFYMLKEYKGSKTNFKPVHNTLKIYNKIKKG